MRAPRPGVARHAENGLFPMRRLQTPIPMLTGRCLTLAVRSILFFLLSFGAAGQNEISIQRPANSTFGLFTNPYRAGTVPPIRLENSSRLESLIRAGNLYLSAQDVVALAIENNIDVEVQRYGPLLAQEVLRRAKAGGALRSVGLPVAAGPQSVSLQGVSVNPTGGAGTAAPERASARAAASSRSWGRAFRRSIPRSSVLRELSARHHPAEQHRPDRNHRADPGHAHLSGAVFAELGLRPERAGHLLQPARQGQQPVLQPESVHLRLSRSAGDAEPAAGIRIAP